MRVAIFDFDGTLYKEETFQLLMKHLKHHPSYHKQYKTFFRWVAPRYIAYKMKLYPEAKLKERSIQKYLAVLDHLSKDEVTSYFKEAAKKMQDDFNPDVVAKLNEHIADGVHVMLVSGAYTLLIKEAINELTFDTIIGTDIPFKENYMNKEQAIYHVNGKKKNEQIHLALADNKVDWKNSYAYADSYSDLPVLELVGHPVAVRPDSRLQLVAEKRQWKVI